MQAGEYSIDVSLVRRLLLAQFPQWASLSLFPIVSQGTDHVIYRLGEDKVVRMPRTASAASQVEKEHLWLPQLAPLLPLSISCPLARGIPTVEYPLSWSVYQWISGETATSEHIVDPTHGAIMLGRFVSALRHVEIPGGPIAGSHNFFRGVPLRMLEEEFHRSLASLHGVIDVAAAGMVWELALQAAEWEGPSCWIHGDLHVGNLLARAGELCAVIDFGGLGMGDPACDIMVAWTYLSSATRPIFRTTVGVDEATWTRGRGWALYFGVVALPYYQSRNPMLAAIARRAIEEALGK